MLSLASPQDYVRGGIDAVAFCEMGIVTLVIVNSGSFLHQEEQDGMPPLAGSESYGVLP